MPAPAVILATLSLITGLIGTMSGTGVTIHSAVQSKKAVELGQEALQREEENLMLAKQALDASEEALQKLDEIEDKKIYKHPDDYDWDGDLDVPDCFSLLVEKFDIDTARNISGRIADLEHSCHKHYSLEMSDRDRRDAKPMQFDIADMDGDLHYPVPREGEQTRQSSSETPDDEDYALQEQEEEEEEEAPCVPIPTFVTGLCGHVAKDPTVSVIVLETILVALCVEVMVVVFCAIWLRRRCHATCSKLIRRGASETVVIPHC